MISGGFDGLVCDLDGVVYRGDEPIPGAADAVSRLRAAGVRIVFCTNNSRATVDQYVAKLESFGIPVEADDIVTSATVTGEDLRARGLGGARAIVVGGEGLTAALTGAGISIETDPAVDQTDLVAVGWDLDFDYDKMRRAATAVRGGAVFVASNDDATYPSPRGLWPGTGAILASIEVASGRRAEVMGKPHPPMMEAAARRLSASSSIAIVGDRPDTDLAGGRARGWTTILVTSGVTTPEDAARVDPPPDLIVGSLADLVRQ